MSIFFSLIAITFLFILSAFWSISETALTSLSKYRIKKIIALNKSLADTLRQWLKSPYYILTTIMIGDTLTNLAISTIATIVVFSIFHPANRDLYEFFTWLAVTFAALIFGELTPKLFGRLKPEKTTLVCLPILSWFVKLIRPLVLPLVSVAKLLFPRFELIPFSRLTHLSIEEIRGLITEADTKGVLGKETSLMLQRALRLGELDVSQIMTPADRIEAVNLDQDEDRFLDMVVETGRSRVPVYHGILSRIAGFIHTKDLLLAWRQHRKFSTDLIRPPYFIPPDKKVHELLRDFQSGQTHLAFVVDAFGNLMGLVTLEDVLEEVVGEILDEYDLKKEKEK